MVHHLKHVSPPHGLWQLFLVLSEWQEVIVNINIHEYIVFLVLIMREIVCNLNGRLAPTFELRADQWMITHEFERIS
jgi:hypothetical protein